MKARLFLLMLFLGNHLFSQTPVYFENNQEWLTTYSFYSPGLTDCVESSFFADYTNGDTLIGTINYKKIGRRYSTSYYPMTSTPCPNNHWDDLTLYRLLRQSNDSIFEYSLQNGSEELVITYNLSVGDNFALTNYVNLNYSVQAIDTISLNGQNHRVFYVDTLYNHMVIEGVGHYSLGTGGFLSNWGFGNGLDHTTSLDCYAQNSVTYWSNPDIVVGSCSYLHNLGLDNLASEFEFELFPNPTNDAIHITSAQALETIEVISITGTTILKQEGIIGINSISLTSLTNGSYVVIVRTADGNQAFKSFQKN